MTLNEIAKSGVGFARKPTAKKEDMKFAFHRCKIQIQKNTRVYLFK